MPLQVHYIVLPDTDSSHGRAAGVCANQSTDPTDWRKDVGCEELLFVAGVEGLELYLASEILPESAREATTTAVEEEMLQRFFRGMKLLASNQKLAIHHAHGKDAAARFFRSALGWLPDGRWDSRQAAALRQAQQDAQHAGLSGPVLNHLYARALWLTEKVRIETGFFRPSPSVATAIIEIAGKIFGELRNCTTLLVGTNAEAIATAGALEEARAGHLYFVPHSSPHGELLTPAASTPTPVQTQNGVPEPAADLIVLFEGSPLPWHEPRFLQKLMQKRHNAPLLLVDLVSARARKEQLEKISNLYCFSREDLNRLIVQQAQVRVEMLQEIERWIAVEAGDCYRWLQSEDRFHFGAMVGRSPAMQRVFEWIARLARTDITVLVQGESGTGKELVAKAIHEASGRAQRPFVVVNCGAIPENLLESELFGHVRGAFTGAIQNKKGLFEEANTGTIFLDEIGELPAALQVKLLRFLQENEIKRLGGNQTMKLDVRVIAASNRDLQEMLSQGKFRSDLFYRLNVVQIALPPLRERPEDIPVLARYFLRKFAAKMRKPGRELAVGALQKLKAYSWPGNVRELENGMERAVALSLEHEIGPKELPENIQQLPAPVPASPRLSLKEMERRHIIETLKSCDGNFDEAARLLGIGRTTLWRKLKEYQAQD
ncbi:MAG: sigma 54-interacting transcriptional regulator [bacterium]